MAIKQCDLLPILLSLVKRSEVILEIKNNILQVRNTSFLFDFLFCFSFDMIPFVRSILHFFLDFNLYWSFFESRLRLPHQRHQSALHYSPYKITKL